jgi:hypothetical protein
LGVSFHVDFDFDSDKDQLLINTRGVSFVDAIAAIEEKGVLLDFPHPNSEKYPGQHILVVNIGGYAYCVPYEAKGETLRLKTVYPSRKFKHLIEGEEE